MSRRGHYQMPAIFREPAGEQLAAFGVTSLEAARINVTDPPVSEAQRGYMGAALARKRAGRPRAGDPKMSEAKLREYARKPR